jgi:hypothetical protein
LGQSVRQSELFAGNDWRVLYRAFTNINFNASDPQSVNLALRQYIQQNYPEDFNDWIESSEFVALIDLLSWLAGSINFRLDINARENFLDTAEARESILRLARFLSYQPHRNQGARGLLKLVSVQTDDDVIDGFGTNLNNASILWNDPDNPDWFEQFTLILNNALIGTNPFGIPLKQGLVGGITTQLYRVNNAIGSDAVYPFNSLVNGSNTDFEIVNMDFDINGGFFERDPDFDAAFNFCYRNDGNGNASANTGFFLFFKQGTLNKSVFNLATPIENRVIDISVDGINQTDVTVQTVNDAGSILQDWTQVPVLITDNITYNAVPASIRNIYQVVTRDNDQISVRFSDGRFGAVPIGNIRIWYRVSAGDGSLIRPQDMQNIQIIVPYTNARGVSKNLFFTFSLADSISNSVPAETDEQVRRRAPQVFATQNRMVSGEDYNVFPLQTNLAVALQAVNRTYSGHSRFIDLNDPTGTFQDTVVFSDDGIVYSEPSNGFDEVPLSLNKTSEQIIEDNIQPRLAAQQTSDFLLNRLLGIAPVPITPIYWYQSTVAKFESTGLFVTNNTGQPTPAVPIGLGAAISDIAHYINEGALVKFQMPVGPPRWVAVASVTGNGTFLGPTGLGPVELTAPIPMSAPLLEVVPAIRTTLTSSEVAIILSKLDDKFSFTLWYDWVNLVWVNTDLLTVPPHAILVMTVEFISGVWRISTNGLRYVFESNKNVRWFFDPGSIAIDSQTGLEQRDSVTVLSINPQPDSPNPLGLDLDLILEKQYVYPDGFAEPRRVQVTFADQDQDGIPDNPETFVGLTLPSAPANLLFWSLYTAADNNDYYQPLTGVVVFEDAFIRNVTTGQSGTVYFQMSDQTFWIWDATIALPNKWSQVVAPQYRFANGRGGNGLVQFIAHTGQVTNFNPTYLKFQWKHFATADHRIDPSQTNIIDIFVLDTSYDTETRQWIANGAPLDSIPVAPTELDLAIEFASMEEFKMFSDEIVWRPVSYKFLFGQGANDELRAQFKVVPLANTTLSNGEIQSQVIKQINAFFATGNFDFGETFYYTELAAFIHQSLANIIGSIVIVPLAADATFGDLFEIHCQSDQVFISTASVSDVVIVSANTAQNLRLQ